MRRNAKRRMTLGAMILMAAANSAFAQTAPSLQKTFADSTIPYFGTTTMTLAITNPNGAIALTNVSLTDSLPAGLTVASPNNLTNNCGGTTAAAFNLVTLSGGSLAAGASCQIQVSIQGTQAGPWINTTQAVTANAGATPLTGNTGNAFLNVAVPLPPTLSKAFAASIIPFNTVTTLKLTVTNPNAATMSLVTVSDLFPPGLVVAAVPNIQNSCGGTVNALAGNTAASISGVTLTAGASCTLEVDVRGTVSGPVTNITQAPLGTVGGSALFGTPAQAMLAVSPVQAPSIIKTFPVPQILLHATTVLTIQISNANGIPLTAVAFTDPFPAGLVVASPANLSNSCGGTATVGAASVSLTGGSLAASSSCQIQVTVQGDTIGPKLNTISAVTALNGTAPLTGSVATATLLVEQSAVSFLIRYAANLNIGESVVNFTNTGASSTDPGLSGGTLAQNGEICANVFAYSPDEQLVSCCSCNVTPNALNSLSVKADLGTNTLTPIIPTSLVIKVVATQGGAACTAASAVSVNTAVLQPGLAAWGSTLHALPVTPGTPAGTYGVTETPFLRGTISPAELSRMAQLCSFIRANGSGFGICKSCKVGGLGASAK